MPDLVIDVQSDPDPWDVDAVEAGLVGANDVRIGGSAEAAWRPLAAFGRRGGTLLGGAVGRTGWSWLYVSRLWVAPAHRGSGLGTRLMTALEVAARERGCVGAWLSTFSFQAIPFYESIGYRTFGELVDFPPGHTRHFLCRRWQAPAGDAGEVAQLPEASGLPGTSGPPET